MTPEAKLAAARKAISEIANIAAPLGIRITDVTVPMPPLHQLAREYARHLRAAILPKSTWTHIEAANRGKYPLPGQDAVHDHLDPWMVMHDAWTHLTREPMRADDPAQSHLIEQAMQLSKAHNHHPDQIPLA